MRNGATSTMAEELAQDVMLRIWRSRSAVRSGSAPRFRAGFHQIARHRRYRPGSSGGLPGAGGPRGRSVAVDASRGSGPRARRWARLRVALGELPPRQREIVEKAYLGELTHQEISRETNLPLGTVKSRLRLAIDKLRHELRELRK